MPPKATPEDIARVQARERAALTPELLDPMTEIGMAIAALDELSNAQRCEVFAEYCCECGCKDPSCQCWNNE